MRGVNFDGGGSTSLAVRGGVTGSPSDGNERAVATAVVLDDPKKTTYAPPRIVWSSAGFTGIVAIGETHRFQIPSNKDSKQRGASWSLTGNVGFVSQGGNFLALRGGTGEVIATPSKWGTVFVSRGGSETARRKANPARRPRYERHLTSIRAFCYNAAHRLSAFCF